MMKIYSATTTTTTTTTTNESFHDRQRRRQQQPQRVTTTTTTCTMFGRIIHCGSMILLLWMDYFYSLSMSHRTTNAFVLLKYPTRITQISSFSSSSTTTTSTFVPMPTTTSSTTATNTVQRRDSLLQRSKSTILSLFRYMFHRLPQQPPPPPPQQQVETTYRYYTQVISDVDDTLKSSGGVHVFDIALGGIDTQYPRNTIYPGVAEFMLQLSIGPTTPISSSSSSSSSSSESSSSAIIIPKVAILTARAYELKVFLELKESNPLAVLFRQTASQYETPMTKDWGFAPILYGSIAEWILQDRKGLRKFHNFEQLLQLQQQQNQNITSTSSSPPLNIVLKYIYVGDTGEYDEEAGMAMLQYYPQYVQAIFLHVVTNDDMAIRTNTVPIPHTKYINGRPIIYFRTYVGAAISAFEHGLISRYGFQYVVREVSSLLSVNQNRKELTKFTKDQRYDLEQDIYRANQLLSTIF
jgi:hypothetical protein